MQFASPEDVMQRALQIAQAGRGFVEPNPLVGAVLVDRQLQLIAEGYHQRFGGPHAEVHALQAAGERARGALLFVTLEPCNHQGKTPPCSAAVLAAGIQQVYVGCLDPAPHTHGQGVQRLRSAGVAVEVGLLQQQAETLLRPFTKWITTRKPYVHAKWAMTLDGKIASRTGSSQWISNEESRRVVHQLRGRMDAILVGRGTALADDPLLTARPAGPRIPLRVVLDTHAQLPPSSQLVQTARAIPVLLVCTESAPPQRREALQQQGVEILISPADALGHPQIDFVLQELGRRQVTNLLLEGGAQVLGRFFDAEEIDEVHAFIAPKLIGGAGACGPLSGWGRDNMGDALQLTHLQLRSLQEDIYLNGQTPFPTPLSKA